MNHHVYILLPKQEEYKKWLYVGITDNPDRRLKQHNNGDVISTRKRIPYEMIIVKEFDDKYEAAKYERNLKKSTNKKRTLVKEYFINNKKADKN